MAKAVINLQKESGGITKISSADGTGVTELVVPESGSLASVETAVTDNAIARYDGTTGKLQNSGVVINDSGSLLLTSGTGALGYGAGAGGTVTQLTSKSTSVTLNKPCGTISMHNAALAAGASVVFQVNNNIVSNADNIVLTNNFVENYSLRVSDVNNGNFKVAVKNETTVSLSEAFILNFAIIKGAQS